MIVQENSEIRGNLQFNSFAEILAEAAQWSLSGSFRLSFETEKAIIYINEGEVVFAVSNLRQHRLYEILLRSNRIEKSILGTIQNFTNDMEFAENLTSKGILTKTVLNEAFKEQITEIVLNLLNWKSGNWSFSHLARVKEDIHQKIDTKKLLLENARKLTEDYIVNKFRSFDERFAVQPNASHNQDLHANEVFVFSRLDTTLTKIEDIKRLCGYPNAELLKTLYILWMGNFVIRSNWYPAIAEEKIRGILGAKLTLKKQAATPSIKPVETETAADDESDELLEVELDEKKILNKYLQNVENAESYYEILEIPINASLAEIKTAYFGLAKKYHPDRFHNETDRKLHQRVQDAFTELARAYETLKDEKARELYDFKLRKYLETVPNRASENGSTPAGNTANVNANDIRESARVEFDRGFDLLMRQQVEESISCLARAVQFDPSVAKYHAYYGKALSSNSNQRHKAEAAIRSAMKIEPENVVYRIMLAEFYIEFNLLKRAEGELQRLLAQFPNNREAQALLDTLANK